MVPIARQTPTGGPPLPASFPAWRRSVDAAGLPAVVAVAGSRGKSTVVRMLDGILSTAGLRTALWTDRGVEVGGRRQAGELVPWSRALARVARGELDIAIQELEWTTVHAVGLPAATYPIAAVTNLCVNSDACLIQTETVLARRALERVKQAAGSGVLVLNGEDFAVAGGVSADNRRHLLVGSSADAPLIRAHLLGGGRGAWSADGALRVGDARHSSSVGRIGDLDVALGGAIGFQIMNALTAAALARACGIDSAAIARALAAFRPSPRDLPGSFNLVRREEVTFVVDRPAPPWFLRAGLRAISHIPSRRIVTVVGEMVDVETDDLPEVGRLLGRAGGALVLSEKGATPERRALLRGGIGSNDVPPLIIRVGTERQAINRALAMAQAGDLVLMLLANPLPALRAFERMAPPPAAAPAIDQADL